MGPGLRDWEEVLGEAREAFLGGSGRRLTTMARLLERLKREPGDAAALDELLLRFHSFAGSGATYGFPQVSALGRQGENACEQARASGGGVSPEDVEALRSLVASIRAALAAGSAAPAPEILPRPETERRPRRQVLIVDDDANVVSALRRLVEQEGHDVLSAHTSVEARAALQPLPHGVIVDIGLPDGSGYELVEHVRGLPGGGDTAILMISVRTGLVDRVEAVHCGADGYFEKPLDLDALIRRLEHLLARHERRAGRVLAVEDDPDQARFIQTVLESAGFRVDLCDDPQRFESQLITFAPDLVLMDVILPGVSGYDLARIVRQDERHVALPVVFLTTEQQTDDRIATARAGGDEHLVKPVHPGLLLSVVAARVERTRFVKSLLSRDGLTRLLTHSAFHERAREACARASRAHARPVVWVMIDLDRFKEVNDRHGHPVGDRVLASLAALLRRRLRQSDTLGRYGGEEFAVLLHDLSEDEAVRLMQRLLEEFAAVDHLGPAGSTFRVSFSAGVAQLPPDNANLDSWRRQADEALYAAKEGGRSRVVGASSIGRADARA